ncbi:phosphoglycolate phosphatase-like HAD superfamily hydrolase [Elusimicrobium simillimum]|uniref:HAD family hydrolase n=1 Tax=Elusimicrobium simillimum TaxID=3143438 RepID=UPI003C6F53B2
MNNKQAIIFDLDGTITNTFDLAVQGSKDAIKEVSGIAYSSEEITKYFGKTEEAVFKQYCGDKWQQGVDCYAKYFEERTDRGVVFPGMIEIFDYLKANGIKMALVTGRGPVTTEIILRRTDIRKYFDYVKTGSVLESIKTKCMQEVLAAWGQNPRDTYYIGDIPHDAKDSLAAGVNPLGANWYKNATREELLAAGAVKVFSTVEEFSAWVKEN